jgi:hypothetical protein
MARVFVPWVCKSAAEQEADATAAKESSVPVAEARAEEPPADLDTELNRLDAALGKLDELTTKNAHFPAELAAIETKHKILTDQELDSIEAMQARSAEMSKLSAMRELGQVRQKKLATAITAQTKAVIEIGGRAASLLEQRWWTNYTRLADEARGEFHRLFFHPFELPDLLASYKPLVLLNWLKIPDFRTGALDIKLTKCRALRVSSDRLREFEKMTFEELSEELEAQERESRERRRQYRPPPGYPEPEPPREQRTVKLL